MKRYVKILIALAIIAVIVVAAVLVYKTIQRKKYPLLNYEYESRDSFYEVYEGAENVEVIDNNSIIMTIESIEIPDGRSDEVEIEYAVENVSEDDVFFSIECMEINGRMILSPVYVGQLRLSFLVAAGETQSRTYTCDCSESFWRNANKPSIDRVSFEISYRETGKGTEKRKEYIRLYPEGESAFEFEPPKINVYDTVYDKKNIILAITGAGTPLGCFLYNGTKSVIEAELEIEKINGLTNYIDEDSDTFSNHGEIWSKSILPGACIVEGLNSDLARYGIVGFSEYCYDIHYCITGTKDTIDDTARIYPYGKEAYEKHSYKYDDSDVVIYEDEEYKVSVLSAEKRSIGDGYDIYIEYYIENKTDSEMRFSIPFSQICDTLVYDGFDFEEEKYGKSQFITLSTGDTIASETVYASTLESDTCYVALCIGRADEEEDCVQIVVPFKIPFDQEDG